MDSSTSFSGIIWDNFKVGNNALNDCFWSPKRIIMQSLAGITGAALFILGSIGAAGILPGSIMGWVAVGLGGGAFALSLAGGNLKKRKFELIVTGLMVASIVTVGGLGAAGILSGTQVGCGIFGTVLASMPLICFVQCFIAVYFL